MEVDAPRPPAGERSNRIQAALRHVLEPIVRFMLSRNLPFQQASRLLREVYVDVAIEELGRAGRKLSDSRLSLLTGIHRKELKRLRDLERRAEEVPAAVSLGSQLVARWISDERFLDDGQRPRPLRRRRDGFPGESFDDLVTSVSRDIHPRSVLDEWQRLGIVRVDDEGRIHLVTSAFVPHHGFEEKLFYFGRNLHDHLDAAVRNLEGREAPLLDRSVHYEGLSADAVDRLAAFAEREGMKLLRAANRFALELREEAGGTLESFPKTERMTFGLYFHRGPAPEAAGAEVGDSAPSHGEGEERRRDQQVGE